MYLFVSGVLLIVCPYHVVHGEEWVAVSGPAVGYFHTCQPPEYKNLETSRNLCIVRR